MTQQIIEPLTQDEITVLEICCEGGVIAEIGRWQEPVERLVRKGYLEGIKFNWTITPAGRAAFDASDDREDKALAAYVDKFREMEVGRAEISAAIMAMVEPCVELSRRSSALSGKDAIHDLDEWLRVLRREVARKLGED